MLSFHAPLQHFFKVLESQMVKCASILLLVLVVLIQTDECYPSCVNSSRIFQVFFFLKFFFPFCCLILFCLFHGMQFSGHVLSDSVGCRLWVLACHWAILLVILLLLFCYLCFFDLSRAPLLYPCLGTTPKHCDLV